jgi:hypothetical protein
MSDPLNRPTIIVEYPKMLYKPDGKNVTVQHANAEAKARELGYMDHAEAFPADGNPNAPDDEQAMLDKLADAPADAPGDDAKPLKPRR